MIKFYDPGTLKDGELIVRLLATYPGDPAIRYVPAYKFELFLEDSDVSIGHIHFRLGNTEEIVLYGGHIGYGVNEAHRGHRYAARACRLLLPLARRHRFETLWITCNPDNHASRRTCELVGAEMVEVIDLPPDNEMYQSGERQKCRYQLKL